MYILILDDLICFMYFGHEFLLRWFSFLVISQQCVIVSDLWTNNVLFYLLVGGGEFYAQHSEITVIGLLGNLFGY